MPLVETKDLNALIDHKSFYEQPINTKQKLYEKLVEIPRTNYYTTGNLLDYSYHQNYYKLIIIRIDLSRQIIKLIFNKLIPQGN